MNTQLITTEQLARLYAAANKANSDLDAARKAKDKDRIVVHLDRARVLNSFYDACKRQYKRQQKAAHREEMRTTLIRWYLDQAEQAGAA